MKVKIFEMNIYFKINLMDLPKFKYLKRFKILYQFAERETFIIPKCLTHKHRHTHSMILAGYLLGCLVIIHKHPSKFITTQRNQNSATRKWNIQKMKHTENVYKITQNIKKSYQHIFFFYPTNCLYQKQDGNMWKKKRNCI